MFFLLLPILGTAYSLWRIWQILPLNTGFKAGIVVLLALSIVLLFVDFGLGLNRVPISIAVPMYEIGTSSIFILLCVSVAAHQQCEGELGNAVSHCGNLCLR